MLHRPNFRGVSAEVINFDCVQIDLMMLLIAQERLILKGARYKLVLLNHFSSNIGNME
jgi:hypothetical protein